jgi:Hemerythrin HHE cation binding domain
MTTRNLPGSDAARYGTGDADLTMMLAVHAAFRRDLERLTRAAASADLSDPARRASVRAGWELLKSQLHQHHAGEDTFIWPELRQRLSHSDSAQSVLDAMESEHKQIDPLVAAVDGAFAGTEEGHGADLPAVSDAADALITSLTGHLSHEERDGLPLIGVALTEAEWRRVGIKIGRAHGLSAIGEVFGWLADGADQDHAAMVLGILPPPMRLIYRAFWKPRYARTARW